MRADAALTARSERPPLLRLARIEARKMVDTRAGRWLIGLTVLAALGGALGETLAEDSATIGSAFGVSVAAVSVLLPILGVLLVTSEWSQRTALITFTLVPARSRVVVAKAIGALGIAVGSVVLSLILAAICAALTGAGTEITGSELGRGLLYQLITVSIGFGLGLALTNSALAIVTYFVAPLLVGAIGAISTAINDVTSWLDQSVLQVLVDGSPSGDDWAKIAVTVAVWIVLPVAVGLLRLRRGDID